MSKKTIYLSESQIDGIIGQGGYLNKSSEGDIPPYSATEVTTGEGKDECEPTISDKIEYSLSTSGLGNRRSGLYCSKNSKKKVFEGGNKDLKDKTSQTTDELHSSLMGSKTKFNTYKDHAGYKTICNLTDNRDISYNEMYRLKNRLENLKKDDIEYQMLCGDELLGWINNTIGRDTFISAKHKDNMADMGFENTHIKPHSKNTVNTKSNNNIVNINYE